MKSILLSAGIILIVVLTVILSSVFVSVTLGRLEDRIYAYTAENAIHELENAASEFDEMRREFKKSAVLLSLLISDSALEEIDLYFGDVINYANLGSREGTMISISRLRASVEHIRTLAEFGAESVF